MDVGNILSSHPTMSSRTATPAHTQAKIRMIYSRREARHQCQCLKLPAEKTTGEPGNNGAIIEVSARRTMKSREETQEGFQ